MLLGALGAGALASWLAHCGGDTFQGGETSDASPDASQSILPNEEAGVLLPDGGSPAPRCRVTRASAISACGTDAALCPVGTIVNGKSGQYPFGLAVDDTFVYWAEQTIRDGGSIGPVRRAKKIPAPIPTPPMDVAAAQAAPTDVAVDDAYIYWITRGVPADGGRVPARVLRVKKSSCTESSCAAPETLFEEPSPSVEGFTRLLVLDPDTLYVRATNRRFVLRKSGAEFVETDNTSKLGDYQDIAASEASLYYSGFTPSLPANARVGVSPREGGSLTPYAFKSPDGGSAGVGQLTTDCRDVFAAVAEGNRLASLLFDTSRQTATFKVLAALPHYVFRLAADELFVYAAVPDYGGVYRVKKDGSEATGSRLADDAIDAWDIALDDDAVYYSDHTKGTIRRLRK